MEKNYLTTIELAKLLGISRIAVFKKIKAGQIKAEKIGRNFVIHKKDLEVIFKNILSESDKREIKEAVEKAVKEYEKTLRLLGKE